MTTTRLELPAYTDAWMMGDRFGDLVSVRKDKDGREIARVLCDRSGKTRRVLLEDCKVL